MLNVRSLAFIGSAGFVAWTVADTARAADVPADPSNYQELLATLQPGDNLVLAPGSYPRLTISGIHGTADAPISISGPASGDPAIVTSDACCNTVQLYDSSFVAIRNLVVDVGGLEVDAINAKDTPSHDILLENNTLQGFPAGSQQIVGINTKIEAWNWTIRGNRIIEPGTGLYLGGSEGEWPFVAGVIEGNVVVTPVGYCMQIKHQNDYTPLADMPAGPSTTIIRNNIFIKDDRESPDGDRPNLLVGGFPDAGTGADDLYEVYGNLLFANPREALFQATGRVSIHDNVFVATSPGFAALVVTSHQGKSVELAHVYNNTIFGGATGISVSEMASQSDAVVGNLVFAATPISGPIGDLRDNLTGSEADAATYVNNPVAMLGVMDFYPLPGAAEGTPLDLGKFTGDTAFDRDFNGTAKGDFAFRGAYAGAGRNPCGPLDDQPDDCTPGGDDTGGDETAGGTDPSGGDDTGGDTTGGGASEGGEVSGTLGDSQNGSTDTGEQDGDDDDGCGCAADRAGTRSVALLAALFLVGRRRSPRVGGRLHPGG